MKVSARSASDEKGPLGLQMAPSGCVFTWPCLGVCAERKRVPWSLLLQNRKGLGSGLHPYNPPPPA